MKQLLLQSDDFGISYGVSAGILDGIKYGVIRNTGIFINMDDTADVAEEIKNVDVCLGIDINYVCGAPVSDPSKVPHLIDSKGMFIKSSTLLANSKVVSMERGIIYHFEKDPYPYDEILLETENQVKKFIAIFGRLPEYIHPHSICTPNSEKAAETVAKKYGIYHTTRMMFSDSYKALPGGFMNLKGLSLEEQINAVNVEENLLTIGLPSLKDGEIGYFISHSGYADMDLFNRSSLTLRRVVDLKALMSKRVADYIKNNDFQLITYRDLHI